MILDRAGSRLFVASDNSDSVAIVDTATDAVIEELNVAAPKERAAHAAEAQGRQPQRPGAVPRRADAVRDATAASTPSRSCSSPATRARASGQGGETDDDDDDCEHDHERDAGKSHVIGLIPTGWYPSARQRQPGRPHALRRSTARATPAPTPRPAGTRSRSRPGPATPATARNQYVWQLHKAGFLSLPVPRPARAGRVDLAGGLQQQVQAGGRPPEGRGP